MTSRTKRTTRREREEKSSKEEPTSLGISETLLSHGNFECVYFVRVLKEVSSSREILLRWWESERRASRKQTLRRESSLFSARIRFFISLLLYCSLHPNLPSLILSKTHPSGYSPSPAPQTLLLPNPPHRNLLSSSPSLPPSSLSSFPHPPRPSLFSLLPSPLPPLLPPPLPSPSLPLFLVFSTHIMAEELARKELLLRELVVTIANRTGLLLELVNYNVEGECTLL